MTGGMNGRARKARFSGWRRWCWPAAFPQAQSAQVPSRLAPVANASPPQRILEARIDELGRGFDGEVGIAVREVDSGWTTSWNGDRYFPQQSVSKFWVALTAFAARRRRPARPRPRGHRPARGPDPVQPADRRSRSGRTAIRRRSSNLIFRALTQSDNTCNDIVLRHAGGPDAVRALIAHHRIDGIRFGPGERADAEPDRRPAMEPGLFGRQRLLRRRAARVPADAPPRSLRALYRGSDRRRHARRASSPASPGCSAANCCRRHRPSGCSSIMSQTRTGPQRLTGGLAPGLADRAQDRHRPGARRHPGRL